MKLPYRPARGVLLAALAVVGLILCWQLGVRSGQQTLGEDAVSRTSALESALGELTEVRKQLAIARATEVELRNQMSQLMRLSADDRAELELYRRINNADAASSGLGIDSVSFTDDDAESGDLLHVTLVQSRGRGRVSGSLRVSVLRDGETVAELAKVADGSLAEFDLRFFETVSLPLELDGLGAPDKLRIDVQPDDGTVHKDFTEERDWPIASE